MTQPTHGAVPIVDLSKLLSYFKTTPMPHDVSHPFIESLSNLPLVSLTADQLTQEK